MPLHLKLLCALLLCNVLMRAFTNGLSILPKFLNVIDIPIVGLLFLVFLARRGEGNPPEWSTKISRRLFWFGVVLLLGTLLNPEYLFPKANISQWIMLLEPLMLFVALINLPFSEDQIATYVRLLKRLFVLQAVLGVLQLGQRLSTGGSSEMVHGTFPGNAEQYAAFMMLAVFYLIGMAIVYPERKKKYFIIALLVLLLIISIDNKASWLGVVFSLSLLLWRLEVVKLGALRVVGPVVVIAMVAGAIAFLALRTSGTATSKFEKLFIAYETGNTFNLGKIKAYVDIARSHFTNPHMLLVGAGPSNFYSRASRQFYLSPKALSAMYSNPDELAPEAGEPVIRGGAPASGSVALSVETRIPYYFQFYGGRHLIYSVGTIQVDQPFSPYAGLLGETGLIGTVLYLSIYLLVFGKLWGWLPLFREDPNIFPLMAASCGLMLYLAANSVYGPFLETTRYTTILWSMIGLVTVYVRQREEQPLFADQEQEEEEEDFEVLRPFSQPAR